MNIKYIKDSQVDDLLDEKIRELLSRCFTHSDETIFKHQRYFREVPTHRYLIVSNNSELIAHIAVHDKQVLIDNNPIPVAGIAEVCVDPNYRQRGCVKQLLNFVHKDIESRNMSYSILFGDKTIYQSSGYREVKNLYVKDITSINDLWQPELAMIKEITRPWPDTFPVKLEGTTF